MPGPNDEEGTRRLHRAYAAGSPEEVAGCYDLWAAKYETHMRNLGYAHPALVSAMITRHVARGIGPILDAGAGTGIVAEFLVALGYPDVAGFDGSKKMLARAAAKGIYRELRHMYLGRPLDYPDAHFAAVVSAGVFTQGHAPLSGLDELVRVTRPGGHIVFSVARTYLGGPFQDKREELERQAAWSLVDASALYDSTPLADAETPARVFVFRVT